jgi:WD40 repeat protein
VKATVAVLCLVFFVFAPRSLAQECVPPPIVANAKIDNLFSAEQEMILGELTLQQMSREFRLIRDPELVAFVQALGEKLVKHLPPTGLKYTFHLVDYPDANAFNIPGGHVFVSRKLIAFANSEDEIASVIAHELGHAAVHHAAQDISASMRKILKISTLGDRKDVTEKYNLLIENARTAKVSTRKGHEGEQQMEADRIGIYAAVAAGYDPNASFAFFDRITESEGKTGSWFSDIFGGTKPEQKRLREMAEATQKLPAGCRAGRDAKSTEDFLRWQAEVVHYRESKLSETLPGLIARKELAPKLSSDLRNIRFSEDGKRLLMVDDFGVTVADAETAKVMFQIPVADVSQATFTNSNSEVVLITDGLRFERWNIAAKEPIEIRELVLRRDCLESGLSPDGKYLACVDTSITVKLIDTKTGKTLWEKKKFYELNQFELLMWLTSRALGSTSSSFFRIAFTPDSSRVLFSRSNSHRFTLRIDGLAGLSSENTATAVDLKTMKQMDIGSSVKRLASGSYVFLDPDRILGNPDGKLESGGVFSFPDGKRLQKFTFGARELYPTADPNYIIVKPTSNTLMGIYDVSSSQLIFGMNKNDVAIWKNTAAYEADNGKVVIANITYDAAKNSTTFKEKVSFDVPVGTLRDLRAADVSDDFGWLLISTKTRGGVWNLGSGERKVFTRGFRSGVVDRTGTSVALFPYSDEDAPVLGLLNPVTGKGQSIRLLPKVGAMQAGRYLLTRSRTPNAKRDGKRGESEVTADDGPSEAELLRDAKFEVKNWIEDKVVFTKEFKGRVPRYSFDPGSGRLMLFWSLGSEEGKARLAAEPSLRQRATSLGKTDGDQLIEVIDVDQARTIGTLLLESGAGSFYVLSGLSERDWIVLRDNEGRILVYSLSDGRLKHRFFGSYAFINPARELLAVENFPGEVTIYSMTSGDKITDISVNGQLSFGRFSADGGRMFLFTDGQVGYSFDVSKMAGTASVTP